MITIRKCFYTVATRIGLLFSMIGLSRSNPTTWWLSWSVSLFKETTRMWFLFSLVLCCFSNRNPNKWKVFLHFEIRKRKWFIIIHSFLIAIKTWIVTPFLRLCHKMQWHIFVCYAYGLLCKRATPRMYFLKRNTKANIWFVMHELWFAMQ